MKLDTLLINGKAYTMSAPGQTSEAIGFYQGRIAFLGTNQEASVLQADEVIDLHGQTVLPGMVDSHMHLYAYCQAKNGVDLSKARSLEDVVRLLRAAASRTPEGRWVRGYNFDENKWIEKVKPTRNDLDRASVKHPIMIKRCCLHTAVANSAAMRIAGIAEIPIEVPNGIIEVDPKGFPNGTLREGAISLIEKIADNPLNHEQTRDETLEMAMRKMVSKGITSVYTYAAENWGFQESTDIYRRLYDRNKLPLRVNVSYDRLFTKESLTEEEKNNPYRMVEQGSYKLFCDGSLGAHSAALKRDYADDPGNRGFLMYGGKTLTKKVVEGLKLGLQPAFHAIGDRALEQVVVSIENALEIMKKEYPARPSTEYSFRIIHAQLVTEELAQRMGRLPVYIDVQPMFLKSDVNIITQRIGRERLKGAYAWQTMLDAGLILTGGSDCPVETYEPLKGIHVAVNGVGDGAIGETVSVFDAISMYTKNPYMAAGKDNVLGTLSCGKFADVVVLDRDPFTVCKTQIEKIKVLRTYVAGKLQYKA